MDAQLMNIAKRCQKAAYDKTMQFPQIVGTLIEAGFEGYIVDYRRDTTTYFSVDGGSVILENQPSGDRDRVALQFEQDGLIAQVKWAQANPSDYSYAEFCKNLKLLGCAGYIVSFPGRRVLYFGRTAETHVEYFPD